MKLGLCRVSSNAAITPGVHVMHFQPTSGFPRAKPGQFYMVRCGPDDETVDPLLRRPFSLHRLAPRSDARAEGDGPRDEFALMIRAQGRGSRWLCTRERGDSVDVLGPLGNGFSIHPRAHNLLLVAGNMGVAPLVALADEAVAKNLSVTLLLGAPTRESLFPQELIPPEVELLVATDDGSSGHKGLVTELLPPHLDWADQIFACGPMPMYGTMSALLNEPTLEKSVQVCLEEHMACGVGACLSCAVQTRRGGTHRVCYEGPVFELRELVL
ncbi:MAG: dihydroorotate dehydrogenase electron transfer subunit [Chloroflexota bacterium]|nr:MAG: dihydroorotate dehydrogenase electron transfer subunit [Chloroflexota bacterium]